MIVTTEKLEVKVKCKKEIILDKKCCMADKSWMKSGKAEILALTSNDENAANNQGLS